MMEETLNAIVLKRLASMNDLLDTLYKLELITPQTYVNIAFLDNMEGIVGG